MLLNCDLGESFGSWTMGLDEAVMPFIDQANVACGFHGGDPVVISRTLALAVEHGVVVGAHPSYPDLVGFGRRSMKMSEQELRATLQYQIAALDGMAAIAGAQMAYVKPHGALYNDMMADADILRTVMDSIARYHRPVALMLQATGLAQAHREQAQKRGLTLYFEAFADRRYDGDGKLLSRAREGAVLDKEAMLVQVRQLVEQGTVTTIDGESLPLAVDTLCVHGDNPEGVRAIADIRAIVSGSA